MVQRNSSDKFGIQVDSQNNYYHLVSEKKTCNIIKTSSSSGGPDLKKKMKKSRAIKVFDSSKFTSNCVNRGSTRLNDSNIDIATAHFATPKKTSSTEIRDISPNYMKSTRSSNGKKEHFQVSPYISSNSPKVCSEFIGKQVKSRIDESSLKPVKTLTKTSSMKVMRYPQKSYRFSLNQKQNAERATCSSTLKNSKFPDFVMLNPHGTEFRKTSVCRYAYCSLHGHHHHKNNYSLPPLNQFLKAKRRSLKTQKRTRLPGMVPVNTIKPDSLNDDIEHGEEEFLADIENLETDEDFFVEIYDKPRDDSSKGDGNHEEKTGVKCHGANIFYELPNESQEFEFKDHQGKRSGRFVAETDISITVAEMNKTCGLDLNESSAKATTNMDIKEMTFGSELCQNLIFKLDEYAYEMTKNETNRDAEPDEFFDTGFSSSSENLVKEPKPSVREIHEFSERKSVFLEIQGLDSCFILPTVKQDSEKKAHEAIPKAHIEVQVGHFDAKIAIETYTEVFENVLKHEETEKSTSVVAESNRLKSADEMDRSVETMQVEDSSTTNPIDTYGRETNLAETYKKGYSILKKPTTTKRYIEDKEELRTFNPSEPVYLRAKAEHEQEKVDLRHQMMDERKNAEEWMLDYALQRAVNKFGNGQKKKVGVLVKAFETIKPLPNYEMFMQQSRPVEASM